MKVVSCCRNAATLCILATSGRYLSPDPSLGTMANVTRLVLTAALAAAVVTGCETMAEEPDNCIEMTSWAKSDCEDQGGSWVCQQTDDGCEQCDCVDPDRADNF